MKSRTIFILSLAVLIGVPNASAQSFKERLKNATKKVEQKVKQEIKQEVAPQKLPEKSSNSSSSSRNKEQPKRHGTTAGTDNKKNVNDKTSIALFGGDHTALFAPVGDTINAKYGTKSVVPVKPPKEETKQPDWNDARVYIYELDNKSLVDEYLMLDDCIESGYISNSSPASFRYNSLLDELVARTNVLNTMVEHYNEAKDNYNSDDKSFTDLELNFIIRNVLDARAYKTLIRSSLAPLFSLNTRTKKTFIEDSTKEYFNAHGGYENAHKVKWTVLKTSKTNK